MVQSFNPFCHCSLLSLIFVIDPIFFSLFSGFGSTKEGQCAEGGAAATGDGGAWENEVAMTGSEVKGLYGLLRGAILHSPESPCPTPTQKCCHTPTTTISKPPPQEPEEAVPKASAPVVEDVKKALEATFQLYLQL